MGDGVAGLDDEDDVVDRWGGDNDYNNNDSDCDGVADHGYYGYSNGDEAFHLNKDGDDAANRSAAFYFIRNRLHNHSLLLRKFDFYFQA